MSLLGIVRNQHILLLLLIQLTVSLCFIYHGKNKLSYLSEVVVLAGFIFGNLFSIIYSLACGLLSLTVMTLLKKRLKYVPRPGFAQ